MGHREMGLRGRRLGRLSKLKKQLAPWEAGGEGRRKRIFREEDEQEEAAIAGVLGRRDNAYSIAIGEESKAGKRRRWVI